MLPTAKSERKPDAESAAQQYGLKTGRKLSDYNMEAQGNILADYFVLTHLNEHGESA
ncbi:hypothetical protein [Roseateles depolymerans]|uniref:hypothetical protein n=1 Tax=Roseateles depolymerans TaxID=76731 RepID=UPI0012F84439|nr:hypothetical protein [Roseateles depolymerans]